MGQDFSEGYRTGQDGISCWIMSRYIRGSTLKSVQNPEPYSCCLDYRILCETGRDKIESILKNGTGQDRITMASCPVPLKKWILFYPGPMDQHCITSRQQNEGSEFYTTFSIGSRKTGRSRWKRNSSSPSFQRNHVPSCPMDPVRSPV